MQRFILALRQPPTLQEEPTVIDSPFRNTKGFNETRGVRKLPVCHLIIAFDVCG
jgi:hypothetical protein